jgi:hypothetical protein
VLEWPRYYGNVLFCRFFSESNPVNDQTLGFGAEFVFTLICLA